MSRTATGIRRLVLRGATAFALAIALCAATATGALAAKVTVGVPGTVHTHKVFSVTLKGSFHKSELHGKAYLVAFFQYSSSACQATAKAERVLPGVGTTLDFAGSESHSPFSRTDRWKAGLYTGSERVCAYLYPKTVSPLSNVNPIATASKLFHASKST
jgi:hypothetical protein